MAALIDDSAHEQRAISARVEAVGRELARYGGDAWKASERKSV
jgi:hypothetical protein